MLADRVPARVQAQRVNAEPRRPCQQPFNLVERRVGLSGLSEDPGAILSHVWAVKGVLAVDLRPLQPPGLAQRLVPKSEPSQGQTAGRVHAPVVGEFLHHRVQECPG